MAHDIPDHPLHRVHDLRGREVHAFEVDPSHLGTGTGTSQRSRDFANQRVAGAPDPAAEWAASWAVGDATGAGQFENVAPAAGRVYHAGHLLARQNGGFGHTEEGVRGQSGAPNSGNSVAGVPTYDQWRGQEQQFHDQIAQQQQAGQWSVTLRDEVRQPYDPATAYDPNFFAHYGVVGEDDEEWTPDSGAAGS